MVEAVGAMLAGLSARQERTRCHQVVQISPIATVKKIEEDLRVGGPGELLGGGPPRIHGLTGGGEEAWTPCW